MAPSVFSKPAFCYLNLKSMAVGGRGGAVRLYMLANKIPFDEKLIELSAWKAEEKKRVQAEVNPMGYLPVVTVDGRDRPETVATLRYIAKKAGQYGNNAESDWDCDAACDAYQEWRNKWARVLGVDESSDAVSEYREGRDFWYNAMEWYYSRRTATDSPYLIEGDTPGFADAAIFNMVRDDSVLHGEKDLASYPHLGAAMDLFGDIPEVQAWVKDWES